MKKQQIIFMILLLGMINGPDNSHAQEVMCPMDATGSPAAPPATLHVGVILVQFSDWQTNTDARGGRCHIHQTDNDYTYQMYYDHLFGTNYRTDPYGKQTHDEEDLFGSLKEYFDEMSYGDLTITGDIINPHPDPDATPTFVTLTQTKAYWEGQSISPAALLNAALAVSGYSISGYDKIVVIYAGRGGGSGLQPAASGYPFKSGYFVYQIHEKTSSDRGRTQTLGTFEGIGTHCHEFGHLLGLPDMQIDSATWPGGLREFDLMANGNQGFMDGNHDNTSIGGYHAPTPLSGWGKLVLGWATYTDIATDQTINFPSFDESNNIFVRFVNDSDHDNWYEGEYFIIENRRPAFASGKRSFDGDMMNGLLIFHRANTPHASTDLNLDVVEANGVDEAGSYIGSCKNAHLFPGTTNNTAFTPLSNPSSNIRNGPRSGFALTNIAVNGNGISADAYVNYLVSNSTDATASNNARKLVRDSSGNYHLVYESEGEIYYQHSTTGTGNWLGLMRLSAGNGNNKFPCIAERGGNIYVAWQRQYMSTHNIHFRSHVSGSWGSVQTLATGVGANPPLPVITTPATSKLMVVYRTSNNFYYRVSSNDGSSWAAATAVPWPGASDSAPALAPTTTYWGNGTRSCLVYAYNNWSTYNIYYQYYRNGPDSAEGW
ncbi:hypothetical protein DWB58_27480, partial [candidate division KSB1 bacterium]|nr:hypothetical protein [candidate division KSB1 bacterium]